MAARRSIRAGLVAAAVAAGAILAVMANAAQDRSAPAPGASLVIRNVRLFDGSGKTLLPGLIDSHVHVWTADNLKQCLAFGVIRLK